MSLYLDTAGHASRAIAVCDRCHLKVPQSTLVADGNAPGLKVCPECSDNLDPWRLPARHGEDITIRYPRPDEPLSA
jgi:hypothetical protein